MENFLKSESEVPFPFKPERDEKNGRVRMWDGGDVWVFVLVNGEAEPSWEPKTKLSEEKYKAMRRQAAAILLDMRRKKDLKKETSGSLKITDKQINIPFEDNDGKDPD